MRLDLAEPLRSSAVLTVVSPQGTPKEGTKLAATEARNAASERASGIPIDGSSVAHCWVFAFLRCAAITGAALARGLGTHGPDAYRAPHQRFLQSLTDALVDAGKD